MSVTVDVIPLLPGEAPEQAIARIYDGGIAIVFDPETEQMRIEENDDGEPVEPAPEGAFDRWRAEVLRRLHALHEWRSENFYGYPHLWSEHFGWQVELNRDDITLRWRYHWEPPVLTEEAFLAVFEDLDAILHWPGAHGTYCRLSDRDEWPDQL